jgi:hypothetical protein
MFESILMFIAFVCGFALALYMLGQHPMFTKEKEVVVEVEVAAKLSSYAKNVFEKTLKQDAALFYERGYDACKGKYSVLRIITDAMDDGLQIAHIVKEQQDRIIAERTKAFELGYNAAKAGFVLDNQGNGIITVGKIVDGMFVPYKKYVALSGEHAAYKPKNTELIEKPKPAAKAMPQQEEYDPGFDPNYNPSYEPNY